MDLSKCATDIGDGAHRPRDQDVVDAAGIDGRPARRGRRTPPVPGWLPPAGRRVCVLPSPDQRLGLVHLGPGSGARSGLSRIRSPGRHRSARRQPDADLRELLPGEDPVREPREDLVAVEAHPSHYVGSRRGAESERRRQDPHRSPRPPSAGTGPVLTPSLAPGTRRNR